MDKEEAHGPDDIQRLYIVLRPESGERCVEVKQDPHSGMEGSIHTDATSSSSSSTSGNIGTTSKSEGGHGIQVLDSAFVNQRSSSFPLKIGKMRATEFNNMRADECRR